MNWNTQPPTPDSAGRAAAFAGLVKDLKKVWKLLDE